MSEAPPPSPEALTAPHALTATMSRAAALARVRALFAAAGLDEARRESRLLVLEALGLESLDLLTRPDLPIGDVAAQRLAGFVTRRLAREPVARILGAAEFWGLPFRLGAATLVPRPDTETLVEAALAGISDRHAPLRLLDLGTGSGAILVALLHELPNAHGTGIDRSAAALAVARDNAALNGLSGRATFVASDWAAAIMGSFDLVVSNPPYIRAGDIPGLQPEVARHDPLAALDGGPDGLDAYRVILRESGRLLAAGAQLVLEIGFDQAPDVTALGLATGLQLPRLGRDLAGHPRVLAFVGPTDTSV